MIKVAIIIPSLVTGGAENMAAQLAAFIDKEKFRIKFLILYPPMGTAIEEIISKANIDTTYFYKNPGFSLKTLCKVHVCLNKFRPNLIHTHLSGCIYVILWALLNRIKILHTVHNRPIHELRSGIRKIMYYLYKSRKATPVAISDIIAREIKDLYKIHPDWIETVYNPVNISRFLKKKTYNHHSEIVFVNVARFAPQKNQVGLVKAFNCVYRKVPNSKLILVGDGELRGEVEKKVNQLGLNGLVVFTGNISDVSQVLDKADIFVMSSHYEGLPMTVLEAMASGLPVVSTAVGGVPDIVKNNGLLVKAGDTAGLAKAMIKLANNNKLRKKMGKHAMENVKKFDIPEITFQYERLYEKLHR